MRKRGNLGVQAWGIEKGKNNIKRLRPDISPYGQDLAEKKSVLNIVYFNAGLTKQRHIEVKLVVSQASDIRSPMFQQPGKHDHLPLGTTGTEVVDKEQDFHADDV